MKRDRSRLSDVEIDRALAGLPGWARDGDAIVRTWTLADFDAAIDFINQVADVARALDHHPDLSNVYDRVTIAITTHDAGGLTPLDFEFAARVSAIVPG